MGRFVHALVLGLVGAGIVHIAVLLLIPSYSQRDAWAALAEAGELYAPVRIDATQGRGAIVASVDPLFDAVACRFDLEEGPVRLSASRQVPFWSVSVYDRIGQNVFSLTDRTSADGLLDLVVATPVQMIELRNALPPDFAQSVFVEANIREGIAVVRSFVADDSWEPTVARYLERIDCRAY